MEVVGNFLAQRPPAFLLGPLIGLVVVALYWVLNERIGVLGGYSRILERVTGRVGELGWKAWFLFGVIGGALAFRLASGFSAPSGYGWLSRTFDAPLPVIGLLVAGGALIGFGAKLAGGCTSGNGIGGCSAGSPASLVATATFMATAIVGSFVIRAVIS
jgi:uncharacterized membrane protein YedE/YeeE